MNLHPIRTLTRAAIARFNRRDHARRLSIDPAYTTGPLRPVRECVADDTFAIADAVGVTGRRYAPSSQAGIQTHQPTLVKESSL